MLRSLLGNSRWTHKSVVLCCVMIFSEVFLIFGSFTTVAMVSHSGQHNVLFLCGLLTFPYDKAYSVVFSNRGR